ncbi:sodium-dependent glucose transporter 1A-like [Tropilaelaps mercedesae]|uniref:Sodium-dependent glucose transporter 1A-like n=1 Tax=Tropilaelaps mercedesae TaxID=418985 RepID=A0A1V9XJP4_9ACAR|nr:sodium-dependent glucose transporter 1A-like [Tropilaelaps mercedesae]
MTATKHRRTAVEYWHSTNQILSVFAMGLYAGIFGPSLLDLAEIYSGEPSEIAIVNSTKSIGSLIGSIIGGYFFTIMNDQIMLIIMLVLSGTTAMSFPLLVEFGGSSSLHASAFISGAAGGIFRIGSQVRLVRIWKDKSASALQAFHTAFGVGAMMAPFMAAPFLSVRAEDNSVIEETRLWIPYVIFGAVFGLILVSMVCVFCIDPSNIEKEKREDGNTDTSQRTFEIILVSLLFIYLLIYVNTEVIFSALLSVYAVKSPSLQFSKSEAAYLSALFWTTFTGGRVVSIFTAIYFNLETLLWISHILLIVSSVMLIAFSGSGLCTCIGTAIFGLGLSSLYGAASGHAFDYFVVRHFHLSAISIAGSLGVAVSSYFIPPIVDEWPIFLQWYTGVNNVLLFFVLVGMLWVTRDRVKVYAAEKSSPIGTEPDCNQTKFA